MRNTTMTMLVLAIHILLYVSVILDVPVLRQCIGFVYLTFIPGLVILGALGAKTKSFAVDLSLSVTLSIAFVMFVGLLANTLYPLLGISAPLSTLPFMVTASALTLAIFIFSQRKEISNNSNKYARLFHVEINTEGAILCTISILLLSFSIVGALYDSVFLLVSVMAGTAAIFFTSIFLYKRIPSNYYAFVLFAVSLSLLLETSLISRHIMGWDIFGEYSVYRSVRVAGYWTPPGIVSSYTPSADLNSILSVTILPTAYSTVLNLNGELIFKIIYPFIFCFVPILLFKAYETQLGKIVALLSVFFFIADPNNLYGLGSLSLAREMITYLFLSAVIFCFVKKDIDLKTRRVLVIAFSAGLAVSHYAFAFVFAFLIVFVFVAMQIFRKKEPLMNLTLVLCIVSITFAWYMYVATPPLNNLTEAFHNIASRLTTDLFNPQNRLDPGMAALSPTSQTASLNGLIHKIVIYICEFFVVVGAVILVVKPKEFKFHPVYKWMAIFAAFVLLVCIAVPNVAPTLNFLRFYRYAMIFLAPLFILGGVYFLGLFKRIRRISSVRSKFIIRDLRLLLLTIVLVVFFLYRSGFVNTVTRDLPYSFSLDFNRMKTSIFFVSGSSLYNVYVPEQDLFGARWLEPRVGNNSLVYAADEMGGTTLIDFTTLNPQSIDYIANGTQIKPGSCAYLRSFNVLGGMVAESAGYFNLSDMSPPLSQNDKIYSNGASDIYFAP